MKPTVTDTHKYTAEELDELFRAGSLERIGMGSRRACYRLPCGKLCIKCYRSDAEILEGKYPESTDTPPLSRSVVKEIQKFRFDEKHNTSCQEYRYWKKLRDRLPSDVFSFFPQTLDCILVSSRGWCIVEEIVHNFDDTDSKPFATAYRKANDSMRSRLLTSLNALVSNFIASSIRLYDPQNIVVQMLDGDEIKLRLVDFEPASRSLIPVDSMLPFLVRMKTQRRITRWLQEQLGVSGCEKSEGAVNKSPISISFSVSDNYSQHLAVVLASFLVNNPDSRFVFHVLHRNISNENQLRIRKLEQMYPNGKVCFHLIDATVFDAFPIPKELEHVTQEMYYRYILPDVLQDENRTIYSDVDVICVGGNVRPLWELDLQGNILAAVSEGEPGEFKKKLLGLTDDAPYFNSGMLVMDLEAMRAERSPAVLMGNTIKYANRIAWPDQDVINITFRNRILELDVIWNCFRDVDRDMKRRVVIRHFANATQKPWCNIWKNMSWPTYLKYLIKSPYRKNSFRFIWGHIKGFFFFKYTKKGVTRYLICGIRVWRSKQ